MKSTDLVFIDALAEMQKAGCRFMDTTELIAILS